MSVIKFVVPLALTVIVAGSHAVAQNIYVDIATGIAQQGLAQADELVALAPNQLRKSLDIAIEGHDFESEEFCLGNIQAVVNLGSVLSNMMPFSEVWTLEDERGPVGKLRVMLNGQRVHTEVFCDGATLKALELPWGVGDAVPHRFTNNSLSALLGVGLNFKLQGLLDDDVEPSPEMLSSMGAAANTSDGLVKAAEEAAAAEVAAATAAAEEAAAATAAAASAAAEVAAEEAMAAKVAADTAAAAEVAAATAAAEEAAVSAAHEEAIEMISNSDWGAYEKARMIELFNSIKNNPVLLEATLPGLKEALGQ
jgi:hypothetical protein